MFMLVEVGEGNGGAADNYPAFSLYGGRNNSAIIQTITSWWAELADFPAVFFHISHWYLLTNYPSNKSQLSRAIN